MGGGGRLLPLHVCLTDVVVGGTGEVEEGAGYQIL